MAASEPEKKKQKRLISEDRTAGPFAADDKNKLFSTLKLAPQDCLNKPGRFKCKKCDRMRKWYCCQCFEVVLEPPSVVPKVKLPIHGTVIHYPAERLSKSTALHSRVMAKDDISFIDYPALPEDLSNTVLVFPSETSKELHEYGDKLKDIRQVVFIESTWGQSKKFLRQAELMGLPHIRLAPRKTLFWRTQDRGVEYLATIEAIYFFYVEYHTALHGEYNGEYDNLLFFYTHMRNVVDDAVERRGQLPPEARDESADGEGKETSGSAS